MQGTGKRLGQGCRDKGCTSCKLVEIQAYNAFGHQEVFRIRPIEQEQVFAQAVALSLAIVAVMAWRGIGDHNGIDFGALGNTCSSSCYKTRAICTKTGECIRGT